jgi:hypothetical protein
LLNYPDAGSLAARLLRQRWPFWHGEHRLYYTPSTIGRQLNRAGFRVVGCRPFWTALPLGYAVQCAAQTSQWMGVFRNLLAKTRLAEMHLPYRLGRTLVVARVG